MCDLWKGLPQHVPCPANRHPALVSGRISSLSRCQVELFKQQARGLLFCYVGISWVVIVVTWPKTRTTKNDVSSLYRIADVAIQNYFILELRLVV